MLPLGPVEEDKVSNDCHYPILSFKHLNTLSL